MLKKIIEKYKLMPVPVKASLWFLVCSFLQKGISAITTPIFTRLMDTADYGNYGAYASWMEIITVFVTLRLYYGVFMQGLVKYEDDRNNYASSMQTLSFVLVFLWTVVYLIFKDFWNNLFNLTTVQMLAMLVTIWATGAFNFWASYERVQFKYRALVLVTLIASVLKPALSILFIKYSTDKVTARILGLMLAELIVYVGLFFVQMRRGKTFYSKKYWKHAIMFNVPLIPHYLSQTVLNSADRIMIRDMVGYSEAGIYTLAYSVSSIMILFNQALNQTITPWMYNKIKTNRAADIKKIAYPSLVGIATLNILLIALAPEVIAIFAPKQYYDAIMVVPPIAMSIYFMFAYNLFATFEFYYEKTKFVMIASVVASIMNVFLNYIFINIYGYYAAGYTTLVCYFIYTLGHYVFMEQIIKKEMPTTNVYDVKILFVITAIFVSIGFAFLATYRIIWLRYTFLVVILCVIIVLRNRIIGFINQMLKIRKKET